MINAIDTASAAAGNVRWNDVQILFIDDRES